MAGATWKVLFQLMGGVSTENSQNFESLESGTHDKPRELILLSAADLSMGFNRGNGE